MERVLQRRKTRFFVLWMMAMLLPSVVTWAQIAEGKCKFLGNVVGGSVPTDFATYWNQVTPENSGKWGSVEGTRDNMNWTGLTTAYNYAKSQGFLFKHHVFIWGNQQPAWIESLPAEEQLEEIEEWMQAYCTQFPETDIIEVVNEPINDPPNSAGNGGGNYINALGGTGTTGFDWIIKSFELAREYCPNAKLMINEYNLLNNDGRTNQYVNIVNKLKELELIDGVGVQCHRFEVESAPETQLKSNLDKLGNTGLPVYITEFDLGNLNNTGTPNDDQQLQLYQKIFPLLWNHRAVHGITLWGYVEGQTWQETAFLRRTNGTKRPALTWLETYVPTTLGGGFCFITSAEGDIDTSIKVYPNPVVDKRLTLEFEDAVSRVSIIDINGKVLHRQSVQGLRKVDVELDANAGVYVLQLEKNKRMITRKLIIQ